MSEAIVLEVHLNIADVAVSAMDPSGSTSYIDADGVSQTVSNADFQAMWNSTSWSINRSGDLPNNNGLGAASPGNIRLAVGGVSDYGAHPSGVNFQIFHELGHITAPGMASSAARWSAHWADPTSGPDRYASYRTGNANFDANERSASRASIAFSRNLGLPSVCMLGPQNQC